MPRLRRQIEGFCAGRLSLNGGLQVGSPEPTDLLDIGRMSSCSDWRPGRPGCLFSDGNERFKMLRRRTDVGREVDMAAPEDMWQCQTVNCGYIYDPDRGDRKGKIPKGTRFEDLPEDWKCPVCGAGKKMFRPLAGPGSVAKEGI